jgi:hypothetical protein
MDNLKLVPTQEITKLCYNDYASNVFHFHSYNEIMVNSVVHI